MSDIFISYKREEQPVARKLANALESEGWSVWWDPKLRAGDDFDEVIEKVLDESRCVIVLWSEMSLESKYVRAEAAEALEQEKLVPVAIENISLPFRFKRLHTPKLLNWDGSSESAEFRKLVDDITEIIGPAKGERKTRRTTSQPSITIDNRTPGTIFRDSLKDGSQGPEMVVIPAGTFQMGDIIRWAISKVMEENPSGLSIPCRSIGRLLWGGTKLLLKSMPSFLGLGVGSYRTTRAGGRGQRPVINVSWGDAVAYAMWLRAQTGKRYRLPTEAEWEYAARKAGKEERWAGTSREEKLGEYAWYDANSDQKTQPVGGKKPNGLGLYDMSGNAWEWVLDFWHESYEGAPRDGSAWVGEDSRCLVRGGSWNDTPVFLRASSRVPGHRSNDVIGFRLAQDVD
jgi:formylglycine-generating enzyme required for sulfatase activity